MKKLLLGSFLTAILMFNSTAYGVDLNFPDVSAGHKNAIAIATLQQLGIVKGDSATGKFSPNRVLNRAEYAKMIVEAKGWDVTDVKCTKIFPDLDCSQWYGKYIVKANQEGIIKGTGEGKAEPGREVLMVEALAMTLRAFDIEVDEASNGEQWFEPYLDLYKKDKINSEITTSNSAGLPRAQAAQMIVNAMVSYEDFVLDSEIVSPYDGDITGSDELGGGNVDAEAKAGFEVAIETSGCPGDVVINGKSLTDKQCDNFQSKYGQVVAGKYWYDSKSGYLGPECDGVRWFIESGEAYGTMKADASCGESEVFINGREIPAAEYYYYVSLVGPIGAGRYWLDASGNAGYEGFEGIAVVNLLAAAYSSFSGSGSGGSSGGGGDNFWKSAYGSGNEQGGFGYVMVDGGSVTYGG